VRLRAKLAKTFTGVDRVVDSDFLRGVLLMIDLKQAAQQALEAYDQHDPLGVVMADLRAALAQPIIPPEIKGNKTQLEQQLTLTFDAFVKQIRDKAIYETIYADTEGRDILVITLLDAYVLMRHTAPPQRKPLTDEEINKLWTQKLDDFCWIRLFARAIEKAHGVQNV